VTTGRTLGDRKSVAEHLGRRRYKINEIVALLLGGEAVSGIWFLWQFRSSILLYRSADMGSVRDFIAEHLSILVAPAPPLIPYPILGAAEPALFRIQNTRTPTAHNST